MAFDGITIAAVVKELRDTLIGGRIYKIAQPENDELLLTIKTAEGGQRRLLISAGASLPLIYLTEKNKPSPMTAPGFCMLLRKHLQNGRITDITQPGLERIIHLHIEHLNEMGDLCHKRLIVEIMGKHSNLIFVNEEDSIIDSIKHISGMVSSVREVLPGRIYFIPHTQEKQNPLSLDVESFRFTMYGKNMPAYKALYSSYTGISPMIAQEICYRAGMDGDFSTSYFEEAPDGEEKLKLLYKSFSDIMEQIKNGIFSPAIVYENGVPVEYAPLPLSMYEADSTKNYASISELLEQFYAEKNTVTRIRQKSSDLRRIVQTALERNVKKYDLQLRQMKDTEKKDKYRIYGELLNTYGYDIAPGAKSLVALNYYTNEMITIPLDPLLTASENAKKYFDKYSKLKRTYEALSQLTTQVKEEIDHLESIQAALDIALLEEDLAQIKEELIVSGYIHRKGGSKKIKFTSKPFHYISSDGFHIYVGKNNYQNDELTFKFATGNDWWFHAKGIPGSHVVVKSEGASLPDSTFEDAARLAAYYSKARSQDKVEIDYTEKKNVKKPSGGKPGFVVYYTNYSMMIDTDISGITQLEEK
ncbi:MAG: NFACT RNA binding domain-containing protein [Lachnospiraceae bacterium]|nr:NFACT RNA binding domain-containing protein [Lachnospiraceae bacterium]